MAETGPVDVFVKAGADVRDAVLSRSDGGAKLDRGLRERVSDAHPHLEVRVTVEPSAGFAPLRAELEDGSSSLFEANPDIVVLSIADDVAALPSRAVSAEEAVQRVRADLVAIIDLIKSRIGAHILVAGVSTVDPADETFNFQGLAQEPVSLRAHRLDLMLVGVSHDEGISIIDVDRLVAEIGAATAVTAAMEYSARGCDAIATEIVSILEDYGFFDDRPLLAQVGAKGAGT
jgi:predicted enzyme involved in methoxymalonyl-ACP biosynthesis